VLGIRLLHLDGQFLSLDPDLFQLLLNQLPIRKVVRDCRIKLSRVEVRGR
jgi:hypothetical protein